jgi:ATP-dependent DNA helicase RecG
MPATRLRIFISSVQKEFQQIRSDLKAFLLGDAVLRRFISEVFLFEELPARDRRADQVYLEEVSRCDVYLGIFGYAYGYEDKDGISPTEHEYDHATRYRKTRLVYVWGSDEKRRAPKMQQLVRKASSELIRRRIENPSALTAEVYTSLVDHLDRLGALRIPPFDTSVCDGATLEDLSRKRIDWFLQAARRERGFPLKAKTTTQSLLTHLSLLSDEKPTNAAVLLFGTAPQRFHRPAETKCVHCHGTVYRRPFASQQNYSGDLFEQADQARDFVLAKINRAVGTRAESLRAPVTYELPPGAVAEAIINALAHRDYRSNGSVEVRLFADRLEVWNPGTLPGTLTLQDLRIDHSSIPNNPLLAESLYLASYIEKLGSGTQKMIELCREAGLSEPDFEQRSSFFVLTMWRDWLTDEVLASLGINERQVKAVAQVKKDHRIANSEYRDLVGVTRKTAARDLDDLVEKGVFKRVGEKRGSHYVLAGKK